MSALYMYNKKINKRTTININEILFDLKKKSILPFPSLQTPGYTARLTPVCLHQSWERAKEQRRNMTVKTQYAEERAQELILALFTDYLHAT